MNKEERLEKALELRKLGYNCAQCVLMSSCEITGIDERTSALIGAGLGAGVASGEICGVANALAIAAGLKAGISAPDGKKTVMPAAKKLCNAFSAPYGGKITCRDLKGKCGATCEELIASGISMLD